MDVALPVPAPDLPAVDRRKLVALVLAGATGAALAEAGVPVTSPHADGPATVLDAVGRTVRTLADHGYDTFGPRKTGVALKRAERSLTTVFSERLLPSQARDAKAVYAQVLTMSANIAADVGDRREAVRTGEMAASLAAEVGDAQTAGHAWSVVSAALYYDGSHRAALSAARRARSHAGSCPSGVMALLAEAEVAAAMGHAHAVLDAVDAAEQAHAGLSEQAWGTPGYSLGTYHPANLKASAGWSLASAGMYAEAALRLEQAAEMLAGTGSGLLTVVWVSQAHADLGNGHVDSAHELAAMAVAEAETRPSAWVARTMASLDAKSPGAFVDLVEQTGRWGFPPAA